MARVGIRELWQNLSVYLRRVAAGERLIVTERREPIAMLGPPPARDDSWAKLLAEGRLSPPSRDLLEVEPPIAQEEPYAGTRALAGERGE